jgi:hypothetical protein
MRTLNPGALAKRPECGIPCFWKACSGSGHWTANHLPLGMGLIPFTTEEEIIAAIDDLDARYDEHCLAARGLAEEYFCAEKVVRKLLAQADLV